MSEERKIKKRAISIRGMAGRIREREDNIYSQAVISDILKMYFDECQKALENGERVGLSTIGTLIPKVHVYRRYGIPNMNDPEGNLPFVQVHFTRSKLCKEKINSRFLKNLKNGFPGLGERCQCNKAQRGLLISQGFSLAEEEDACTEE